MPRYRLLIEYDGCPFVGWQMQAGGPSVQGVITQAIAAFADEKVTVHGAGRADDCQAKSPVKTLDRLDVERAGDEVRVHASARSFLHHQVRSMVGSLVVVGEGKWSADDFSAALAARSRAACGPVAPPEGLYLVSVDY